MSQRLHTRHVSSDRLRHVVHCFSSISLGFILHFLPARFADLMLVLCHKFFFVPILGFLLVAIVPRALGLPTSQTKRSRKRLVPSGKSLGVISPLGAIVLNRFDAAPKLAIGGQTKRSTSIALPSVSGSFRTSRIFSSVAHWAFILMVICSRCCFSKVTCTRNLA